MIRTHADVVEADLAFRGIDFRDLWRSGSGLTLRRLLVLVQALPPDSLTHLTINAQRESSLVSADRLREREAFYNRNSKGDARD